VTNSRFLAMLLVEGCNEASVKTEYATVYEILDYAADPGLPLLEGGPSRTPLWTKTDGTADPETFQTRHIPYFALLFRTPISPNLMVHLYSLDLHDL
jgi:hypothetical protein